MIKENGNERKDEDEKRSKFEKTNFYTNLEFNF